MSETQRIIKYIATAFAIFLIFSILSGIMYGIISISSIFGNNENANKELENLNLTNNTLILDIEVSNVDISIKQGDEFKAETNNQYIKTKQKDNKLYITEEKHSWFSKRDGSKLVVYVPSDYIFDSVSIENGASKIDIDSLSCKKLYMDLGAGKVTINNILVLNKAEIDGGAGEINIENGSLNNLDLDMGIGKLSLISQITGESEIDAGIGNVNLNLLGNLNEYKIILDKGIGKCSVDGKNIKGSTYYGNGSNVIDIDGGVGSIQVDFINNK